MLYIKHPVYRNILKSKFLVLNISSYVKQTALKEISLKFILSMNYVEPIQTKIKLVEGYMVRTEEHRISHWAFASCTLQINNLLYILFPKKMDLLLSHILLRA